jgi:hypothetical protein
VWDDPPSTKNAAFEERTKLAFIDHVPKLTLLRRASWGVELRAELLRETGRRLLTGLIGFRPLEDVGPPAALRLTAKNGEQIDGHATNIAFKNAMSAKCAYGRGTTAVASISTLASAKTSAVTPTSAITG